MIFTADNESFRYILHRKELEISLPEHRRILPGLYEHELNISLTERKKLHEHPISTSKHASD